MSESPYSPSNPGKRPDRPPDPRQTYPEPPKDPKQPPKDPYADPKTPEKDPCEDPQDPKSPPKDYPCEDPKGDDTPPVKPKCPDDTKCPEPTCPTDPPPRPCNPCFDDPPGQKPPETGETPEPAGQTPPPDPGQSDYPGQTPPPGPDQPGYPGQTTPSEPGQPGTPGQTTPPPKPDPLRDRLDALRKDLAAGQVEVQRLEPLKTSVADLAQRIQALEKTIDARATTGTAYRTFYQEIERFKSEIVCFLPTVRCQLELNPWAKKCVCDAIAAVDQRVASAKAARDAKEEEVKNLDKQHKKVAAELEWQKKWYEFLTKGVQQQAGKQRDDLKALKQLADPTKDQCEAYFYLYEIERLLASSTRGCWDPDLWLTTYLDCWSPDCYKDALDKATVRFNTAEADEKVAKSRLEQATKLLEELEKAYKDAAGKRREWILKEIKSRECCGPKSKCP